MIETVKPEFYIVDGIKMRNGVPILNDVTLTTGAMFIDWPSMPLMFHAVSNKELVTPSGRLYLSSGDDVVVFYNPYTGMGAYIPQEFFAIGVEDETSDIERLKDLITDACKDSDFQIALGKRFGDRLYEVVETNKRIAQDARIKKRPRWYR